MDYTAGRFWCPTCVQKTLFIAVDAGSFEDFTCPLECDECGYVYHKVRLELNEDGTHRPVPKVRAAIPEAERRDALINLRREFQESAIRAGFYVENFTKPGRRR